MCRGTGGRCAEFGPPETWSRHAPLPPPGWLFAEVHAFAEAVRLAAAGAVEAARQRLAALREADARDWFVEHAQISSHHRRRVLGVPRPGTTTGLRRSRTPDAVRHRVWVRAHYLCRYCGLPTVPDDVRMALQRVVGESTIPWGPTNASRHGIALVTRTEYDHVKPVSLGGADDEANLVTACAGCNYGKDRWTLAELGLEDPRVRPPDASGWDGLASLLPALDAVARRGR